MKCELYSEAARQGEANSRGGESVGWGLSPAAGSHAGATPAGERPMAGRDEVGGFRDPLPFSCTEESRIHPYPRSYTLIYGHKQPPSPEAPAMGRTPVLAEPIAPLHG